MAADPIVLDEAVAAAAPLSSTAAAFSLGFELESWVGRGGRLKPPAEGDGPALAAGAGKESPEDDDDGLADGPEGAEGSWSELPGAKEL